MIARNRKRKRWKDGKRAPFYFRSDVEFVLPSLPSFVVFFSIDLTRQDNEDEIPFQKWPREMSGETKKCRTGSQSSRETAADQP